ncbi:permease [Paenibacillus sp. NEAU-GSW1]|uniref:permease n=1 Tax=Paenibacillus sp. NEAU-GSW1 TaxID=2682486 RepID=UPI0012E213D6|nr:permease [Paenibacillus sp. NEAU-GSW1]MUT66567.1 permease [Paenibacillus sp. NEAU-GSW1]
MNTQDAYNHFKTAIYCTAGCLDSDEKQLARELDFFQKHIRLSKMYIENHRGDISLDRDRLLELKHFYESRGIETAGGITPTLGDAYRPGYNRLFGGICYTDRPSRAKFQKAVETAASVFDEIIFDDFFFTNCGCDDCLSAKGERTWEQFRLELMTEVSENLIRKPAKAINPDVKLVIKYPNWNEAYQASGYNTESQPSLFDGVYTGTETRDPAISQQHIPRYASYSLLRWMERLATGRNGGGWFDNLDCTYIDYYLEQANLTVFGKAKELTLFCYSLLKDSVYLPPLGFQLEKLDALAGGLASPVGALVYEPHHAKGEDHLYDYAGMLGIPLELTPHFPLKQEGPLFITANAARDERVIQKMKAYLREGGEIIMTSGFIAQMTGKGIEEFTTLRGTGKTMAVNRFAVETSSCTFDQFASSEEPICYPIFDYSTNGTWQSIVAMNGQNNIPILMYDNYSKGKIYSLIVPDNYADLWKLPAPVLNRLRSVFAGNLLRYRIEGPASVGLFTYDNEAFILENFAQVPQTWSIAIPSGTALQTAAGSSPAAVKTAVLETGDIIYTIRLAPSAWAAYRLEAD